MAVGEFLGGGICFSSGATSLIASTMDLSDASWGTWGIEITGTSTARGTGSANTIAMLKSGVTSGAALICDNLSYSGFTDWYLPSKDELGLLFLQKNVVGHFQNNRYWSSSQSNLQEAWTVDFGNTMTSGQTFSSYKSNEWSIRPIRTL